MTLTQLFHGSQYSLPTIFNMVYFCCIIQRINFQTQMNTKLCIFCYYCAHLSHKVSMQAFHFVVVRSLQSIIWSHLLLWVSSKRLFHYRLSHLLGFCQSGVNIFEWIGSFRNQGILICFGESSFLWCHLFFVVLGKTQHFKHRLWCLERLWFIATSVVSTWNSLFSFRGNFWFAVLYADFIK